jgi:hypothetical protein
MNSDMKTKEEIRKDMDDSYRMILSNTVAILTDETLTSGQISNLHLANKIIQTRIDTLYWVIKGED